MRAVIAALSFCLTVLAAPSAVERAAAPPATDNAPTVLHVKLDKGYCIGVLDAAVCDQGVATDPTVQARVDAKLAERRFARVELRGQKRTADRAGGLTEVDHASR